jgi:hypothetical protein
MYFSRGMPVVYYGDEQGFTGDGGDKDAREDLFGSEVDSYNDNDLIGTDRTTAQPNFNRSHPIYQTLKQYAALRRSDPALQRGTQIQRYASDQAGIYAFSRLAQGANRQQEYLLAFNNAETEQTATLQTTSTGSLQPVWPAGNQPLQADDSGKVTVTVPPLSFVIYQTGTRPATGAAPGVRITGPDQGASVNGRVAVRAELDSGRPADVTFAVKVGDAKKYTVIGTDTNPPYAAHYDTTGLADGTKLTFRAIANDPVDDRRGKIRGDLTSDTSEAVVVPKQHGTVTFNVTVPEGTPADQKVYIAGELSNLEPDLPSWDPGAVALTKVDATHWSISFEADEGSLMEYKYTLGSWDREELTAACVPPSNRSMEVTFGDTASQTVNDTVANWKTVPPC